MIRSAVVGPCRARARWPRRAQLRTRSKAMGVRHRLNMRRAAQYLRSAPRSAVAKRRCRTFRTSCLVTGTVIATSTPPPREGPRQFHPDGVDTKGRTAGAAVSAGDWGSPQIHHAAIEPLPGIAVFTLEGRHRIVRIKALPADIAPQQTPQRKGEFLDVDRPVAAALDPPPNVRSTGKSCPYQRATTCDLRPRLG